MTVPLSVDQTRTLPSEQEVTNREPSVLKSKLLTKSRWLRTNAFDLSSVRCTRASLSKTMARCEPLGLKNTLSTWSDGKSAALSFGICTSCLVYTWPTSSKLNDQTEPSAIATNPAAASARSEE